MKKAKDMGLTDKDLEGMDFGSLDAVLMGDYP